MTVPLLVEAWQTDTPNLPGTWRRVDKSEGRWDEEHGRWFFSSPVLVVDYSVPWLRIEFERGGVRQVYRWPEALVPVSPPLAQNVQELTVEPYYILKAVPLKIELSEERQVVMRHPLPKKREVVSEAGPDPRAEGSIRERLEMAIEQVHKSGAAPDVRSMASEVLELFMSQTLQSMQGLETAIRKEGNDEGFQLPIPTYGGLDAQGRVILKFRSTALESEIFVGRDRQMSFEMRGALQMPKRGVSPESLMSMVFAGGGNTPVGEA
jgi:hypothetical protein